MAPTSEAWAQVAVKLRDLANQIDQALQDSDVESLSSSLLTYEAERLQEVLAGVEPDIASIP